MPRHKKPPGQAVDKRNGQRETALPSTGSLAKFDAPVGLCDAAIEAWDAFWEDRPALLLTPSSRVVLLRWIDALDRYLRTTAEADLEPTVIGSTGQPTVNPLYKIAEQARSTMEAAEKQLGIGGLNASSLGLAAIAEKRSLADMNARYSGGSNDDLPENDDDPRMPSVRLEAEFG